jgi:thioredoxin reductase (NADPH)
VDKFYKLIIIGAGPAGLAASIYASRYNIKHIIIGTILGGQISETHLIDNYPGMEDVSGFDFAKKWGDHAKKYGAEIISGLVKNIEKINPPLPPGEDVRQSFAKQNLGGQEREKTSVFNIKLDNGETLKAKTVLLATGTKRRKLNIPGEKEFSGKGVSYCATCDGFFYKDKTVAVIGGSNSAAGAALYLANICQKVYIIYRKSELRAEPFWVDLIKKNEKIEVIYNANVTEILGAEKLQKVKLDKEYSGKDELEIDGLFIEAGSDPDISYAKDLGIETDEGGYVKIKSSGSTSVPGIFAAGDITDGSDKFRQVITAAAEGVIAARSVFSYLKSQN